MLFTDEIAIDKKTLIGRKFEVLGIRDSRGMRHIPMFYAYVRLSGQLVSGVDNDTQKRTVINSDNFLKNLREEGKLINAIVKIEDLVKPDKGFWFYKYSLIKEGHSEEK
jgi:hypothetical protein